MHLEQDGDGLMVTWYCKRWEQEDIEISPRERSRIFLYGTMSALEDFLSFTVETADDFPIG